MAVLDLAPHVLSYCVSSKGYTDEDGDYHKGGTEWVDNYCRCDVVPSGKENVITYDDGTSGYYEYSVYNLPPDCREFKRGDKIKIAFFGSDEFKRGDKIKIAFFGSDEKEFEVKGFHRYQHQCKMWI